MVIRKIWVQVLDLPFISSVTLTCLSLTFFISKKRIMITSPVVRIECDKVGKAFSSVSSMKCRKVMRERE